MTHSHQRNLRKRRLRKMNVSLLEDITFFDSLMLLWRKLKQNIKYYPKTLLWWNCYANKRIRQTFQREVATRNRDRKVMEDFYFSAISTTQLFLLNCYFYYTAISTKLLFLLQSDFYYTAISTTKRFLLHSHFYYTAISTKLLFLLHSYFY